MPKNLMEKKITIDIEQKIANVKATQAFEHHEMSGESEQRCREILFGSTTSEDEIKKILAKYNIFKN
jgi:hypothetical protein